MKVKVFILTLLFVFTVSSLLAHPASKMELAFDNETKLLNVGFDHQVKDAGDHFIYEVKVYLNKKVVIEQELFSQDDTEKGALLYKIVDAKAGDTIKVMTNCNKTGKKSEEITIE